MNKKETIIKVVAGITALVAIAVGVFIFTTKGGKGEEKKETPSKDAVKFKEDYESLNNTVREGTDKTYSAITIPEINPIKYVSVKETIDLLSSDDAIIYAGANWCPWCRGAIVPLLDVAINYNVKNLYYLNLDNDKSLFEIQNKKLVQTKEGTEEYYDLLTIITVKNGEIVKVDGTTIELDDGQTAYDNITEDQYKFYYEHFEELFKEIYDNGCDGVSEEGCD